MAFVYSKTYTIESVIEENAGRHRILLAGGLLQQIDAREMRTFLARYLYKRMRQKPAFIFVYDRREDFRDPWGFTVARLNLHGHEKKYFVDVKNRDGLHMPSADDLAIFEEWRLTMKADDLLVDHTNINDLVHGGTPEYDRRVLALAGDRFGLNHEETEAVVNRCLQFLYWSPVHRFEVSA